MRDEPEPGHLDDTALTAWLTSTLERNHLVGYLQADHVCKVVDLTDQESGLQSATPEAEAKKVLRRLAKADLLRYADVEKQGLQAARTLDPSWTFSPVRSAKEAQQLVDDLLTALGRGKGRGREITNETAQAVWADAAGRCMFEGCGDDLTSIPLYKKRARVGYLAHIVASSPRGPRGSETQSHQLANEPSNIMLMCDKHHRLIDCQAPEDYPVDRLRTMREKHFTMARKLLDSLKYDQVIAVAVLGNLANTSTFFTEDDFRTALLTSNKSLAKTVYHLGRSNRRDERNTPGFWASYLREHEAQIRHLVIDSNDGAAHPLPLAIFPLHNIPTLVLAGRIIGEGRVSQIFQYHRERQSWAWDNTQSPRPPGYFRVERLPGGQHEEVFISLELTAELDPRALPPELAEGQLPWIRIQCQRPRFDCIGHPADLQQFSEVARQAINHVQDHMRVSRVHLVAVTPASSAFRFGQFLQAGHHPEYILYDRPQQNAPFAPALFITGHEVGAIGPPSDSPYSISIR